MTQLEFIVVQLSNYSKDTKICTFFGRYVSEYEKEMLYFLSPPSTNIFHEKHLDVSFSVPSVVQQTDSAFFFSLL